MGAPSKPTAATIAEMKSALSMLTDLQTSMSSTSGATGSQTLGPIMDISSDVGPLINGAGATVAGYYQAHAQAVQQQILASKRGVTAAVNLLTTTIDNYEKHEHATARAANGTGKGAGKGSGSGSGGSGSGGRLKERG
jgi:hypothetical protein